MLNNPRIVLLNTSMIYIMADTLLCLEAFPEMSNAWTSLFSSRRISPWLDYNINSMHSSFISCSYSFIDSMREDFQKSYPNTPHMRTYITTSTRRLPEIQTIPYPRMHKINTITLTGPECSGWSLRVAVTVRCKIFTHCYPRPDPHLCGSNSKR